MRKFVRFDSAKLYKVFKERGLSCKFVASEIGVNASYFSNAKTRGTINEMAVLLLESKYNIPRDWYVIREPEPEKKENCEVNEPVIFTEELKKELYEIVYSAVYHGVIKAFE